MFGERLSSKSWHTCGSYINLRQPPSHYLITRSRRPLKNLSCKHTQAYWSYSTPSKFSQTHLTSGLIWVCGIHGPCKCIAAQQVKARLSFKTSKMKGKACQSSTLYNMISLPTIHATSTVSCPRSKCSPKPAPRQKLCPVLFLLRPCGCAP